jgi:hypothetical protein
VIAQRRNPDGTTTDVTVMERVEETLRQGAFVKDAAARVGVAVETLRRWQATGVRKRADLMALGPDGRPKLQPSDLTAHERNCVELADRMDRAEAEARTALLVLGQRLARGGVERVERTVKMDPAGNVTETIERTTTTEADPRMIQWLLSHRWRDDFGSRVEVTGADGGAVVIDAEPVAAKLRGLIDQVRANRADSTPEALEAAMAAGANGTNGHAPSPNGNGNGQH